MKIAELSTWCRSIFSPWRLSAHSITNEKEGRPSPGSISYGDLTYVTVAARHKEL